MCLVLAGSRSLPLRSDPAFPVVNTEVDNVCGTPHLGGNCFGVLPFPRPLGVSKLGAVAATQEDPATGLSAKLTPTDSGFNPTGPTGNVGYARLPSPPFSFTLPAIDNVDQFFGITVSGTVAPVVADGYYSFIPGTLAPGYYLLQFGGILPINNNMNTFTEIITYDITMTP